MNYRICGIAAMFCILFVVAKFAFLESRSINTGAFNLMIQLPAIASILFCFAGLWKLSIRSSDTLEKLVMGAACLFMILSAAHLLLLYVQPTFVLLPGKSLYAYGSFLLIMTGACVLYTGSVDGWKRLLYIILPVWLAICLLYTIIFRNLPGFEFYMDVISSIVCTLTGCIIYTSKDPVIVNDNVLYELSSL